MRDLPMLRYLLIYAACPRRPGWICALFVWATVSWKAASAATGTTRRYLAIPVWTLPGDASACQLVKWRFHEFDSVSCFFFEQVALTSVVQRCSVLLCLFSLCFLFFFSHCGLPWNIHFFWHIQAGAAFKWRRSLSSWLFMVVKIGWLGLCLTDSKGHATMQNRKQRIAILMGVDESNVNEMFHSWPQMIKSMIIASRD